MITHLGQDVPDELPESEWLENQSRAFEVNVQSTPKAMTFAAQALFDLAGLVNDECGSEALRNIAVALDAEAEKVFVDDSMFEVVGSMVYDADSDTLEWSS